MAALKLTFLCLSLCLWRAADGFVAFGGAGGEAYEGANRVYNPNLAAAANNALLDGEAAQVLHQRQAGGRTGGFDFMTLISRFMPGGRGGQGGGQGGGLAQMLQSIMGGTGGGRGHGGAGAVDGPAGGGAGPGAGGRGPHPEIAQFLGQFRGGNNGGGGFPMGFR